jgi:hypothetical protein
MVISWRFQWRFEWKGLNGGIFVGDFTGFDGDFMGYIDAVQIPEKINIH